jgi:hypothetical protein
MKLVKILLISLFFIGCSKNADVASNSQGKTGEGGSMARFTIINNYLYTVDESNLNVFSINETSNPVFLNEVYVGFRIETLFSYDNKLFIGSESGMFIYSLENPESPVQESAIDHFTSCDPVVTDGTYAYVSLHSESTCGNNTNMLEIYNVTDIQNPVLLHQRNLVGPKGLGLYNNYLIVCDDELKIFDITNPDSMSFVSSIDIAGYDVIIQNNHLIVVAEDGLYQYRLDPNEITNIEHLSTISY